MKKNTVIALLVIIILLTVVSVGAIYYKNWKYKADKAGKKEPDKTTIKTTQQVREESEKYLQENADARKLRGKAEPLSESAKAIKLKIISPENVSSINNGDLLLAITSMYKIEYITSPDMFIVTILNTPIETAKSEAEKWFLNKGFTAGDLCNLGLRFTLDYTLIKDYKAGFNNKPTGCN